MNIGQYRKQLQDEIQKLAVEGPETRAKVRRIMRAAMRARTRQAR